jgi:gluconolactonase
MDFFPQPVRPKVSCESMSIFCEELDHPECVAFDDEGVMWAGGEAGQIYRIGADRKPVAVAQLGGFCLGLTFSTSQELTVCNLGLHALMRIDRDGRLLNAIDRIDGRPLKTPNFSVYDSNGVLYFSDSGGWGKKDGTIYRVYPDGRAKHFAGPFHFPNGLALNAEEDLLFVVESQRDRVTAVPIQKNGDAGSPEIYMSGLQRIPDGAVLDAAGNLYVTCYATDCIYLVRPDRTVELFAYDPDGTILARPTNAVFGGPNNTDLFVANLGRWHITQIPTATPGHLLANQRGGRKSSQ